MYVSLNVGINSGQVAVRKTPGRTGRMAGLGSASFCKVDYTSDLQNPQGNIKSVPSLPANSLLDITSLTFPSRQCWTCLRDLLHIHSSRLARAGKTRLCYRLPSEARNLIAWHVFHGQRWSRSELVEGRMRRAENDVSTTPLHSLPLSDWSLSLAAHQIHCHLAPRTS